MKKNQSWAEAPHNRLIYLGEYPRQHQLPVGREEEDAPEEAKHIDQLQPGEVLVLHVPTVKGDIFRDGLKKTENTE